MDRSVLKEYLVSLGFEVDDQKFGKAIDKMTNFQFKSEKTAASIGSSMAKGAGVFVSALATMNLGITKYMTSVAQADIETEKFANRMWMTESNARSLQNVLNAMGESMSSIYDISANPELTDRFYRLRNDAAKLEGGTEIDAGLKSIRDFQFEFQRFKLLISYGSRYIAYYFSEYLAMPIAKAKAKLKSINDDGRSFVEDWGKRIAKILSWVARLFGAGVQAVTSFIEIIQKLPSEIQIAMAAIAVIATASANPFLILIAAIGAVLLLLDDFYTWKEGGQSLLGDTWAELDKLSFDTELFENIQALIRTTGDLFDELGDKWHALNETVKNKTGFSILGNILNTVGKSINVLADGLAIVIDLVNQLLNFDFELPDWIDNILDRFNDKEEEDSSNKTNVVQEKQSEGEKNLVDFLLGVNTIFHKLQSKLSEVFDEMRNKNANQPFTLPVFAGPTSQNELIKQVVSNDNRKDVHQENKAEMNNTFIVNGSDASAVVNGINNHQQILLNRFSGNWFNNAVQLPS